MSGLAWTNLFVIANIVQFAFGVAITGISYYAYRSSGRKKSLRNSTLGFCCITIGGVLAPIYELGIKSDYNISAQELLKLQIIEGTAIGIGLALLLISVYVHNTSTDDRYHLEFEVQDDGQHDKS
jgi:uncharacterized membrane protein